MYFRGNMSSTESEVNISLAKLLSAFDKLLIISKSDLSDKIKQFFAAVAVSKLLYIYITWTQTNHMEKKV